MRYPRPLTRGLLLRRYMINLNPENTRNKQFVYRINIIENTMNLVKNTSGIPLTTTTLLRKSSKEPEISAWLFWETKFLHVNTVQIMGIHNTVHWEKEIRNIKLELGSSTVYKYPRVKVSLSSNIIHVVCNTPCACAGNHHKVVSKSWGLCSHSLAVSQDYYRTRAAAWPVALDSISPTVSAIANPKSAQL